MIFQNPWHELNRIDKILLPAIEPDNNQLGLSLVEKPTGRMLCLAQRNVFGRPCVQVVKSRNTFEKVRSAEQGWTLSGV
jgi:hypothetical protein